MAEDGAHVAFMYSKYLPSAMYLSRNPENLYQMEKRIVECVPNFSEGRDKEVIRQIVGAIEASGGVKVLDVDPGEATNRTVVTFVGEPEAVVEAAFAGERFVHQTEQLGTGHALMQALPGLRADACEMVLVVNGDTPLLRAETVSELLDILERCRRELGASRGAEDTTQPDGNTTPTA